jgi:hypothetical protein
MIRPEIPDNEVIAMARTSSCGTARERRLDLIT